jgi:hypothetical protein
MDYGKILSRSWELAKKHRYWWGLGVLALFTEGGSSGLFNLPFQSLGRFSSPKGTMTGSSVPDFSKVSDTEAAQWFSSHLSTIIVSVIVVLALLVAFTFYAYCAKAALIIAVDTAEEGKPSVITGFQPGIKAGKPYAWKLWGLHLLVRLGLVCGLIILAVPFVFAIYRVSQSPQAFGIVALVLAGILLVGVLIAAALYAQVMLKMSERVMVLKQQRIVASIKAGSGLIRVQVGRSLLTWLVSIGIGAAYGVVLAMAIVGVAVVLVLIGASIGAVANTAAVTAFAILAVIAVIGMLLGVSAIYTVFFSGFWTLNYRALDYLAGTKE